MWLWEGNGKRKSRKDKRNVFPRAFSCQSESGCRYHLIARHTDESVCVDFLRKTIREMREKKGRRERERGRKRIS